MPFKLDAGFCSKQREARIYIQETKWINSQIFGVPETPRPSNLRDFEGSFDYPQSHLKAYPTPPTTMCKQLASQNEYSRNVR